MTLPKGLIARALTEADLDATVAMVTCERHDAGEVMLERADLLADAGLVGADGDGRIVGGAFLIDADEIWVDNLTVAREFRHRGIARALLQTAFARSYERGYTWTSLSTDSSRGALSLYERLGMTVHRSFTRLGLDL
ncbi:MAG: GNAT family N-acetyltransferase [Actinomycetota bacterium]